MQGIIASNQTTFMQNTSMTLTEPFLRQITLKLLNSKVKDFTVLFEILRNVFILNKHVLTETNGDIRRNVLGSHLDATIVDHQLQS